jgi:hypothetical protein
MVFRVLCSSHIHVKSNAKAHEVRGRVNDNNPIQLQQGTIQHNETSFRAICKLVSMIINVVYKARYTERQELTVQANESIRRFSMKLSMRDWIIKPQRMMRSQVDGVLDVQKHLTPETKI